MCDIRPLSLERRIWQHCLQGMLKSTSNFISMTRESHNFGEGAPRGNPNCHECRGTGRIRSKRIRGFGSTRSPFGMHSERCPSCFPADSSPATKPAPAPRLKPPSKQPSLVDQIVALAELHAAGVLTDEEFDLAKKKLLNN